jgi:transposase-like protein
MAKRRLARAEWEELVREAEAGVTVDHVARRHGVKVGTLKWWCWKLRRGKVARRATKATVQMVPVRVRESARLIEPTDDVVEILVRGALVRVRVGQDVAYIAGLAAALAARC